MKTFEEREKAVQRQLKDAPKEDARRIAVNILGQIVAREIHVDNRGIQAYEDLLTEIAEAADKWTRTHTGEIALCKLGKMDTDKEGG